MYSFVLALFFVYKRYVNVDLFIYSYCSENTSIRYKKIYIDIM